MLLVGRIEICSLINTSVKFTLQGSEEASFHIFIVATA